MAYLKQNNMDGAVGSFKQAVDAYRASPAAQFNASLAYEANGQPLQALDHAQKYLDLAPNSFDAAQVRDRIGVLQKEQADNPRAIYTPADCGARYRWALLEVRRAGSDPVRKAKVYDIMTTAQRGDCAAAEAAYKDYAVKYP